jgi:hypothetical protein
MAKKRATPTGAEPKHGASSDERTEIEKASVREATSTTPRLRVHDKAISIDHADPMVGWPLLEDALGSSDRDFLDVLLKQLANASGKGGQVEEELNFMVSVIKGIEPRDQVETMLAAQMAAIHNAIMTFTRRLANVESIPQQDSAERALNKLSRTFIGQMEALKRSEPAASRCLGQRGRTGDRRQCHPNSARCGAQSHISLSRANPLADTRDENGG